MRQRGPAAPLLLLAALLGGAFALSAGSCDFNQGISDYCVFTGVCVCDAGPCCVTYQNACDDADPCCGGMVCSQGFCAFSGVPQDGGPPDAGDAGQCTALQSACSADAGCCSGHCGAAGCCSAYEQPCTSFLDCCDPNASCNGTCQPPVPTDAGTDGGGTTDGGDAG